MIELWLLTALIFLAALLYSTVGHAGASGYLAAMALFSVASEVMRPSALILNVFVATIGTIQYYRAGCFSWRLFVCFTGGSVPCAFVGGTLTLPPAVYRPVVGAILLLSAVRLVMVVQQTDTQQAKTRPVPILLAVGCGGGIGLLSGLTGTGGGIFLSPLLLFTRWANTRQASGVAAAFILANSIAGLLGLLTGSSTLPNEIGLWVLSATLGGLIGVECGRRRLGNQALRWLLAIVLVIAGCKMILV